MTIGTLLISFDSQSLPNLYQTSFSNMPRAFLVKKDHRLMNSNEKKKKPNLGLFSIDNILNSSGNSTDDDAEMKENRGHEVNRTTPEIRHLLSQPITGLDDVTNKPRDLIPPWGSALSQSYLALNYRLQQHLQAQKLYPGHLVAPLLPSAGIKPAHFYNHSEQSFHEQKKVEESRQYNCEACCKSYSTFSGLSKHKQFHCQQVVKKQFSCKYCDKVYGSLGALKMHIRTHTLPCKCGVRGKAFSRPWLLQGHIRTHTGEKPFSCQHCNRAFADRSNLRAHLQTHSDVKKYSCKNCTKTFSRMSLLLKHEETGCAGLLPKLF